MNNYERTITEKWNLPLEESIKIEALSQNLDLFTKKDDIIKELYKYLKDKKLVQKILSYSPFIDYQDTRYQIYITYLIRTKKYVLKGMTGNDSVDNEMVLSFMQGYYNYYPKEDSALKKYQEKLSQLKEYPEKYCYLEGSCTVLQIEIKLVDAVRNCIIERNFIKVPKL